MIINITLKDPDGVYDAIQDAAEEQVNAITNVTASEKRQLIQSRHFQIDKELEPWIEYSEYVRLQIDTTTKTATVLLNK
jgi:hypothetical protein